MTAIQRDGVRRTTGSVSCLVEWPRGSLRWEDLSPEVREAVREHMDAACDLVYGEKQVRQ